MQPETFRGRSMPQVLERVRIAMGDDVVIVTTRGPSETDGTHYEVVAAPGGWTHTPVTTARHAYVIALVGPPGAGKTTTAVKLALHPGAFGGRRVGLLTLDTYRAGGAEQLQLFAEITSLPMEIAFDPREATQALRRLDDCEIILVDTPGRGLRTQTDLEWQSSLLALAADEVHLVVPAGLRADVAAAVRESHKRCAPTHVLLTMIDELPTAAGLADLRAALSLPVRWTTNGPAVPGDLYFPRKGGSRPAQLARAS